MDVIKGDMAVHARSYFDFLYQKKPTKSDWYFSLFLLIDLNKEQCILSFKKILSNYSSGIDPLKIQYLDLISVKIRSVQTLLA